MVWSPTTLPSVLVPVVQEEGDPTSCRSSSRDGYQSLDDRGPASGVCAADIRLISTNRLDHRVLADRGHPDPALLPGLTSVCGFLEADAHVYGISPACAVSSLIDAKSLPSRRATYVNRAVVDGANAEANFRR